MMPKISAPDRADAEKRAAARFFWWSVLGAVLAAPVTFWLFRAIGLLDSMPLEAQVFMMVVCLVAMLAFMFTHRNADGTIQYTRAVKGATSAPKPPQGRRTVFLLGATCTLYWLVANVLHPSQDMLTLAKIASFTAIAVLCARYVIRWRKPDASVD
jgi:membrane protein DedA with SNARE-associated domain